jgi:hypothetical protein
VFLKSAAKVRKKNQFRAILKGKICCCAKKGVTLQTKQA